MPHDIQTPGTPPAIDRLALTAVEVRGTNPHITGYCLDCQGNCFELDTEPSLALAGICGCFEAE
jgi:hypothetical protein